MTQIQKKKKMAGQFWKKKELMKINSKKKINENFSFHQIISVHA